MDKDLTRVEITSKLDLELKNMDMFNYNVELPSLFINDYMVSFDDLEDKTLLALVYAVQNGYPVSDLSRRYKDKVKNKLLEGGQKLPFKNSICTAIIKQCLKGVFYPEIA